jgi:hypothetical protein
MSSPRLRVLTLGAGPDTAGASIIAASTVTTALYAVAVGWDAAGLAGGNALAIGTGLALFVLALVVWVVAFARALVRSTQGDDLAVASMFFLQDAAPRGVKVRLLGIAAVMLVLTIVTLATNPVGFLVNMLPIGFAGLWGARHGTYPERTDHRYTGRADGRYRQRTNQGRGPR